MIIKPRKVMPFGLHKGKLIESVIIKYPDNIFWLSQQDPLLDFECLYTYIEKRIAAFDAKPFINAECAGRIGGQPCTHEAKRFTLYRGSAIPTFWCATCDPLQLGASESKIAILEKYYDALFYLDNNSSTREQKRKFVRRLAEAKGLTGNVTRNSVLAFFHQAAARETSSRITAEPEVFNQQQSNDQKI